MRTTAPVVTVMVLLLFAPAARAEGTEMLEMELRLFHALGAGGTLAAGTGASLLVDAARAGDRWQRVWAVDSESRRMRFFTGCVASANVRSERVEMTLFLRLPGGASRVAVDVKGAGDGRLAGSYTVTTGDKTIQGEVDGHVKPARPPLPEGFQPVRPGERPRILFRKSDIPALKKKLATPLGKVLFEKMGNEQAADAIGAGVKYQLTGEAEFADLARKLAEMQMAGKGGSYSGRTAAGRRPQQVAVAYDLCCDAWPADFKKQAVAYMLKSAEETAAGRGMGGNSHVCSNWWAKPYSALAFIGLALWGEKGPQPPAPPAPTSPAEKALHDFDLAEWKRLGEVNMDYQLILERGRQLMYWHCRESVGTGGFRGECAHYGLKATEMPAEYAACYRRMFGHNLSPYDDITHMVPRSMFCHYYPREGRSVPLNINGMSAIWGNYFTCLYPIVPAKWQPAVLWAWNRQLGIPSPAEASAALKDRKFDEHGTGEPAWFFLSYPLDAEARDPGEVMPLTWQAPDMGYYGFRSGWKGDGEFVLNVYAKARHIGGWKGPNAGTFRLFGLGQMWNETYTGREIFAWEENRVMLPEQEAYVDGCGRVVHAAGAADGSGSLTIDMGDVYAAPSGGLYSMYGGIRYPAALKDSGVRALRAMAIDFGGACGAPCLFVLVDTIRGGKGKVWTWNLGSADLVGKVKVSGGSFVLPKGDAVLRGTFVAPAEVKVEAKINEMMMKGYMTRGMRKVPSILATGGGDFFLVVTVGPASAAAPQVKVQGAGLDAKVTVGRRRIAFDPGPPARVVISEAK